MPAAPAPPPVAPAPSVTPPVTPAPAAEPQGSNDPLFNPALEEHFKSYEKPKEATPAKPAAKAPEKPVEKAAAKPDDKKPEPVKAEEKKVEPAATPEEFKTNKELRSAYETTKQKASQMEAKIKEFEAKLATAEKTGTATDEKVWQERISAKEKELAETRSKLAETDFTQSADYQNRYFQPHVNNWKRAMSAVMGLQATDETGAAKAISQHDAEFLLSLPDAKALEVGKQMFGDNSTALIILATHKNRIAESQEVLNQGRADFQKLSEERRTKDFEARQQHGETLRKLWERGNKEMAEKSPWFQADENDPEGSELLKKGYERADLAFTEDANRKPEDQVALHVELRNKAAAHERLVSTIDKLTAERDALKKERDELLDSAPKGDPSTPKTDDNPDHDPLKEIDRIQWGRR